MKNKLHIAWIMASNSSVPYFNWFAEWAAHRDDIIVSFICLHPSRPQMIDDVGAFGWKCHWLYFNERKRKRGFIRLVPQLYRLFGRIKPDVIHSHLFDDALPSLLAARMAHVPVRVITKADASYHYYHHPRYFRFDLFNNRNATHIVAISGESKQFILEKEKAPEQKVKLIHHGIPFDKLAVENKVHEEELKARFHTAGRFVIGTVSRFIEWKGYRHIVAAASQIVREHPEVLFLFTGKGDQEQEIRQLVIKNKLDNNVILTGWIDREQMPSYYRIMDVYLHAASREPFGFVIAEAMANATPVVSTRTGAAMDAIEHKVDGYLVENISAEAIADGLRFMMKADRKNIGNAARKKAAEMYSFGRMAQEHLELYRSATGSSPKVSES